MPSCGHLQFLFPVHSHMLKLTPSHATHSPSHAHTHLTPSLPHILAEDHSEVHEQQVNQLRNNRDSALEENKKWRPRLQPLWPVLQAQWGECVRQFRLVRRRDHLFLSICVYVLQVPTYRADFPSQVVQALDGRSQGSRFWAHKAKGVVFVVRVYSALHQKSRRRVTFVSFGGGTELSVPGRFMPLGDVPGVGWCGWAEC